MSDRPAGLDAVLAALDEPRRSELAELDGAIRAAAPSLSASVSGGSIAYGHYRYRYASGREGDWAVLTLAPRKAGLSLYVGGTQVERWADRLPSADCGKGCIRVRRAADLAPDVLAEVVAWAVRIDGCLLDWAGLDQAGEPAIR
jgi:uncharacterized protein YdhG (YjbR/CyaY superfamily)